MNSRFALYNFAGKPVAHYLVDEVALGAGDTSTTSQPDATHMIYVIDVSGSMYYDIEGMKDMLTKLLTLEEFQNAGLLVSLLSYSSSGDVRTHFARVPVSEVMETGSKHLAAIREIRVRGLTCISQAFDAAKDLIQDGEVTCISLHSDGYANDRSPTSERFEIDRITKSFSQMPNVFVNTIAYSAYSDFKLLSGIANALSGVCIRASNIRQVYTALHDTTALLSKQVSPAIDLPLDGATYQIFVSPTAQKVNGAAADLSVRGLSPDDTKTVYRYREVTAQEYAASSAPICGETTGLAPVVAFGRANLAEGNINTAKYALVTLRDRNLLDRHAKALTNDEIADLTTAFDEALFTDLDIGGEERYGIDTSKPSVLEVVNVLDQFAGDITLDATDLGQRYRSRGLRRVAGTRDEEGNLVKPRLKTAFRDDGTRVSVLGFNINTNTATINMKTARPINLVTNDSSEAVIDEVAGIRLDLSDFRNYTIVGDGSLNVDRLRVRISTQRAFRALASIGVVDGDFDPTATYTLGLDNLPLVNFTQSFSAKDLEGVFDTLARAKVLTSVIAAMTKGSSDTYSADQIEALKEHYLSPSLYLNFPTTNDYTDLQEALATGQVDTRLSYKVDLGTPMIANLGKLHSANKFLERMFTVTINGEAQKKPNFQMFWEEGVEFGYKTLSSRTKITAVDDLMKPLFEDLLNLQENGAVDTFLRQIGADPALRADVAKVFTRTVGTQEATDILASVQRRLDRCMECIYRDVVCPVVFYIGSTGLIPDEFGATALTADQIAERYPSLNLGKAEKEGTFFDLGNDVILSVYTKTEYFTVNRQKDAASVAAK